MRAFLHAFAFGPSDYVFWLLVISVACFVAERAFAWRPQQRALRKGFAQDVFYLLFYGQVLWVLMAQFSAHVAPLTIPIWERAKALAGALHLVQALPWPAQLLALLLF